MLCLFGKNDCIAVEWQERQVGPQPHTVPLSPRITASRSHSALAAHITLTLRNAHYSVMVKHSIQSIIERGDIAIAPPGPSSR